MFAQSRAAITAPTRKRAEPVSVPRKSRTGVARLRAQAVLPPLAPAGGVPALDVWVVSPSATEGRSMFGG
jgi:hypothetical protein